MKNKRLGVCLTVVALLFVAVRPAGAHGLIGQRFFPATLAIDDPFVADELSLPTVSFMRFHSSGEGPGFRQWDISGEFSKRLSPDLGFSLAGDFTILDPAQSKTESGFDNMEVSLKYVFFKSAAHETLLSAGVSWDVGGTGSKRIGAESFDTVTPQLFFGKGFGDLPAEAKFLRPFAVTGLVGVGIPSRAGTTTVNDEGALSVERHPHTLEWGFAIEYSLPYLQAFVQDVGLREPFNRMIPVVEFAMSTALDRGASGTTGTVNPGIIWAGQYVQLAVEAVIPVNSRSGSHVGWIAQLHFFLDDLFPTTIGRPIFGK